MKPHRIEATLTVGFIGLTLGWMFMGVNAWNPQSADTAAAMGLMGGVGGGVAVSSMVRRWLEEKRGK